MMKFVGKNAVPLVALLMGIVGIVLLMLGSGLVHGSSLHLMPVLGGGTLIIMGVIVLFLYPYPSKGESQSPPAPSDVEASYVCGCPLRPDEHIDSNR